MPPFLKPHPAAELFPMMPDGDLAALAADIKANGQREPIILHEGMILDGRNRYAACQKLGIEPETMDWPGRGDPAAFVISMNLHRRHLSESQRAMVAAKYAKLGKGSNQHTSKEASSIAHAAEVFKVGRASVERARIVQEKAAPELVQAVTDDRIPVTTAAQLVHLPKQRQQEIATTGKKAATKAAKRVAASKQATRTNPPVSSVPRETEHDKDLRFLEETWAATCESAHAAFLTKLGVQLRAVA